MNDTQTAIVNKHLANDSHYLKKWASRSTGMAGFSPEIISGSYELVGLVNRDAVGFFPHFEFNVETSYRVDVPKRFSSNETTYHMGDRLTLKLKGKTGGLVNVYFSPVNDLFQLRNLVKQGQILSIPQVCEVNKEEMPLEEKDIKAKFYFRASSSTYGQLVAVMKIDHPSAEEVIQNYLAVVDRRIADYTTLEKHFQEKDASGKTLWEDENLQSFRYNWERRKLHKAMFGELKRVLKQGNLEYRLVR